VDVIRGKILQAAWPPGARLQPVALAETLGTSSTVVREALTRLAGDGLVRTRPNRGFFVADLDLRELADLTELRCVTEQLAARLAVQRGDLAWESELTAAHHRMSRTPRRRPDDPAHVNPEWQTAHKAFHMTLLEPCGCLPMLKVASDLSDSTELYRCWAAPYTAPNVRDVEGEHRAILDAALARDADELGALLRTHYEATLQVVLASGLADAGASRSAS
jgi:DNA-binding GntR family transcriptional regulator